MNKQSKYALKFWDDKILKWERMRYSKWLILYPLSWTVRWRLIKATQIINLRAVKSWKVLELGCGSGLLADKIVKNVSRYCGVDIASSAIDLAKEKNNCKYAEFYAMDVMDFHIENYDLVIFLGLTDWLDENELQKLFSSLYSDNLFFSYTEKRIVSKFNPYWYYRKLMDKNSKKQNYSARTYEHEFFEKLLTKQNYKIETVQKASIFNPGVLIWAKRI